MTTVPADKDPLHVDLRPILRAFAEMLAEAILRQQPHVPAAQPARRLYTLRQAAAELGCSLRTLERVVSQGFIRTTRLGRRSVRISEAELRRYLDQNT